MHENLRHHVSRLSSLHFNGSESITLQIIKYLNETPFKPYPTRKSQL